MRIFVFAHNSAFRYSLNNGRLSYTPETRTRTRTRTRTLPSEQPLVDGGERQHFEQQPDGQREEDECEGLNEEVEADVEQRAGQLLQEEEEEEEEAASVRRSTRL